MEHSLGTPVPSTQSKLIPDEQVAREHAWAVAARAGDRAAFGRLVEAYQSPIYNLTYRMLGNPQEAEDAAQETFLRAYVNLSSYDPARKFSSWLFSIASHYCIDRLRRRRSGAVSLEDLPGLCETLPDHQPQPETVALTREEEQLVQRLLVRLPPDYRLIVALFYWHDLSCQEVGEVTGLSKGAVKVRLHRGRKMLAQMIQVDEAGKTREAPQPASPRIPSHTNPRKAGHSHALSGC
jgi:RNA polymerase sigma-70 factor (ECF subfamily)